MKYNIEIFMGQVSSNFDSVSGKVNRWLEENADAIQVERIEHQQSIDANFRVMVTVMVVYAEKQM